MAENKIELKSVGELLGMKFLIPSYQRGYRWTEQQVKDLLNDIREFMKSMNSDYETEKDDFYCLQPLVVKECIEDKEKFLNQLPKPDGNDSDVLQLTRNAIVENTKWEVIDGQQRLTTIFIILNYLKDSSNNEYKKPYSIDYQTRNGFDDFFEKIKDIVVTEESLEQQNFVKIKFDEFIEKNKKDNIDNIDFYHILQTLVTVKCWFVNNRIDGTEFKKTILNRVKFIWYESVDENPMKVFTRLNIGKISLTNAELIKALFLNQSNFPGSNKNSLKLKQQEIASEWDNIEYTLQNDEFWLFLHEKGYDHPTRIDFIFDLICEQNAMKLDNEKYKTIGTDGYRTFRYFYEYFKRGVSEKDTMQDSKQKTKIESCWNEVKKYFKTFQEWFNDLEMYHYVGVLLSDDKKGRSLSDLVNSWRGGKVEFIRYLKDEITTSIENCKDLNNQYEIKGHPKTQCRLLLLLHNIQTVINQNKNIVAKEEYKLPVFYKFPFHLYKKEKWDVEHIDSNTQNALDDRKEQKEWLKYASLHEGLSDELKGRIKSFLRDESEEFENLAQEIEATLGGWDNSEEDKNKIWNFVLLDAGTNRGYGNAIFPAKRRCIIGRDQGKSITIDDDLEINISDGKIAFVPPVTRNVFLKYYNSSNANFRVWNKEDAIAYKNNILETLKDFGVKDSSNIQIEGNNEQQ